ncbi:hypothetical protein C8Q74DRAFT_1312359 [Fomes fomentarius]|nr:hypothetical protein C8Q74DRAFT_1312359 [Fomes fomentarius]
MFLWFLHSPFLHSPLSTLFFFLACLFADMLSFYFTISLSHNYPLSLWSHPIIIIIVIAKLYVAYICITTTFHLSSLTCTIYHLLSTVCCLLSRAPSLYSILFLRFGC